MSNFNIESAIAAAQSAAANASQEGNGAVVEHQATGGAVGASRGAPLSFDDMASDGLSVDGWMKVGYFGISINDQIVKDLKLGVDLADLTYNYSVRFGDPVQYRKSYDRMVDSRGGSWATTLMNAQKVDPRASEYRSVEIPFIVLEDITVGNKTYTAGMKLGYGTSVTGWRPFEDWVRGHVKSGINLSSDKVVVALDYTARKTDKGQWGFVTFNDTKKVDAFDFEGE